MKEAVVTTRDGLERCTRTAAGRAEYIRRRRIKWEEQKGICAICHMALPWESAFTDHISPRGMGGGSRDDSLKNIQAVHGLCNVLKGSRRV